MALVAVFLLQFAAMPATAAENRYIVKKGDNLWAIAQKYDTTISELKAVNNLNSDVIHPEQVLKLLGEPVLKADSRNYKTYTVKRNDNLWTIATTHGVSLGSLRTTNGISGNLIYPGQRLIIPQQNVQLASRASSVVDRNELNWLARAISSEAKGEPLEGQIAVAAVILNRVSSPNFPNSIREVVFQRVNGVYQFSPVQNGKIYNNPVDSAYTAAERALKGEDPTSGALYFYNPHLTGRSNWIRTRPVATVVNNHVFAL